MKLSIEFTVNAKEIETIKSLEKELTKIIRRQPTIGEVLPKENKVEGTPLPSLYTVKAKSLMGAFAYKCKIRSELDIILTLDVSTETLELLSNVIVEGAEVFVPLIESFAALQKALLTKMMDKDHPLLVAVEKLSSLAKSEKEFSLLDTHEF